MIPVNEPVIGAKERELVLQCLDTGWISSDGPFVAKFEERFAAAVNRKHAIAVMNGSVALDAAVLALGLEPGDEVILPTFTIISCLTAILRAGATPVPVDCDPQTWNSTPDAMLAAITPKTRAIMAVHIYGLPVDMDPILSFAKERGIAVIEDAAEAHGLTYKGRPCGSLGDVSTFSFYPNKHVTTGEGGMIVTDSDEIARKCRSLRNLGFNTVRRFVHEELGFNFRMTNVQAALGLGQIERLDQAIAKKRAMGRRYRELLGGDNRIQLPQERSAGADNVYWVFGLVLSDAIAFDAQEMMRRLADRKIGTRPFFFPMHEQPVLRRMGLFKGLSLPVSERIARRGFYIPSGLALTDAQMGEVAHAVKEALA
ncbi:MAG TPA: DegT/DnrJ/EryC1/StrS family aminotransferase [Alphaproteobacteria bacterium]|nr:DegT/DnrJ/EryC1/StrS family aminotransferase [Alphaproteobacteria bacterium]